jgi:hypothetical protein
MNKNVACMCTISGLHNDYTDKWITQITNKNYDKFLIIDTTHNDNLQEGFLYNEHDIRKNLDFPHFVSKRHYWNSMGNRNIIWFYAYLRMINFYIQHPNYEYYWFFDDDIKIDNWSSFLNETDNHDYDFISYFIFKKPDVKSQGTIPVINNRTTSSHMWFERFPGHMDTLPSEINEYFGSFFPTTRYSNTAMQKLVSLNREGYYGYGEGFVPTVLNHYGFKLSTLITSENHSELFDFSNNKIYHKNIVVDWEWI